MEIRNKKIYIVGAIIGILFLVVIYFLLDEIRKNSQEIISQKKELIIFEQKKKDLENLQKEYRTCQKNLEEIENLFVDLTLPIEFIQFLEQSAANSQVLIKVSLATEKTEPEPALSFNVSLSGSFSNILKFIDKIENVPYLSEIINLDIKKLAREPQGNIMANLELTVLAK